MRPESNEMTEPLRRFTVDEADVQIYGTTTAMGRAGAARVADILADAIATRGAARMIVGTGSSQQEFVRALVDDERLDWSYVEVFHMDEYAGMAATHSASFRRWLKTYLADYVRPRAVHYLAGDAPDLEAECERYGSLLRAAPVDVSCVGFGENGHLAFNDPHVADFTDPLAVKLVEMDERCRLQQVGEGHFLDLDHVPRSALTVTCPVLMSARHVVACVPERRKAEAVQAALEQAVSPSCPASLVRTHPRAIVYLDLESASLLAGIGALHLRQGCGGHVGERARPL